jgi:hypothetical protein
VSYKEDGWEKKLLGMLPSGKKNFDAIIDGAGGDSVEKSVKLLKVILPSTCSTGRMLTFAGWWCPFHLWNDRLP